MILSKEGNLPLPTLYFHLYSADFKKQQYFCITLCRTLVVSLQGDPNDSCLVVFTLWYSVCVLRKWMGECIHACISMIGGKRSRFKSLKVFNIFIKEN